MPKHQRRRQLPALEQSLWAVHVGHNRVEQLRALHHASFDFRPFGLVDQQRQQVQRPRPWLAVIRIDVVADVVVADLLRDRSRVLFEPRNPVFTEALEKLPPRFAQRPGRIEQLVPVPIADR